MVYDKIEIKPEIRKNPTNKKLLTFQYNENTSSAILLEESDILRLRDYLEKYIEENDLVNKVRKSERSNDDM